VPTIATATRGRHADAHAAEQVAEAAKAGVNVALGVVLIDTVRARRDERRSGRARKRVRGHERRPRADAAAERPHGGAEGGE